MAQMAVLALGDLVRCKIVDVLVGGREGARNELHESQARLLAPSRRPDRRRHEPGRRLPAPARLALGKLPGALLGSALARPRPGVFVVVAQVPRTRRPSSSHEYINKRNIAHLAKKIHCSDCFSSFQLDNASSFT